MRDQESPVLPKCIILGEDGLPLYDLPSMVTRRPIKAEEQKINRLAIVVNWVSKLFGGRRQM